MWSRCGWAWTGVRSTTSCDGGASQRTTTLSSTMMAEGGRLELWEEADPPDEGVAKRRTRRGLMERRRGGRGVWGGERCEVALEVNIYFALVANSRDR